MHNHYQNKGFIAKLLSPQAFIRRSPFIGRQAFYRRSPLSAVRPFIMLVFALASSFADAQNVDSLYVGFSTLRGEARIDVANEIVNYAFENDYIDSLVTLKTGDDEVYINFVINEIMGNYLSFEKGEYARGNEFYQLALDYYEKTGDEYMANLLHNNIGGNYFYMGDYEKAVEHKLICYEWKIIAGDSIGLSTTLNDLGVIYSQWGKNEMAIRYFEEAEKVERPLNRPYHYASRLSSLAKEYIYIDISKSLPLIKEALQYDEKIEIQSEKENRIATHQIIMGDIYIEMDSIAQATDCYQKAFVYFEERGQPYYMATLLMKLGNLKDKSEQYAEAIALYKQCEEIAEKNNYLRIQRDACISLSESYSKIETGTLSYVYLKKYTVLNDSIFKETSQQQINDFQVKYETAEKQLEIERQQSEIESQRFRLFLSVGGLVASFLLLAMLGYIIMLRTRRNRQLSETNALKDKFFSIISHDLKNPVIAQRDTLHSLAEHAHQLDASTLADYLRKILKSADGLADLLKNLLDWAKIQTGREMYHPVPINLVDALQSDIEIIKGMAERKEIAFEALTPPIAVVTADANMLVTVVRNLLTNAVKFTSAGGKVTLQIKDNKGKYTVSVIDTGVGMTVEQIQNLFSLDSNKTREGTAGEQSSGLGLIVCRDMLQKHGSELNVASEKGCRFWFEINASR